jgi:hypothetical protein
VFTTGQRLELQELLEQVLGTRHVYFQQPATKDMQYPCIVYSMDNARTEFAGNLPYMYSKRYQVTVIHDDPDSDIPDKVAMMQYALFNRHFTANNLHHSVFTLYF